MVHTRPYESRDLAHLPLLGALANSTSYLFHYYRPRHAQYPDHFVRSLLQTLRKRAVTPGSAIRVAIADDADAFTDLSMGEEGRWLRGSWVDGEWVSEAARLPEESRKVAEGRIVGYSVWERNWPSDPDAAARAKDRAGDVWPGESFMKKFERTLFNMEDKYTNAIGFDRSVDHERINHLRTEGFAECASLRKHITDSLSKTTGWITCAGVAVDPELQAKGIGSRLMRWGLERSEKEGVPILVIASLKGFRMYEKLGFEALGRPKTDGLSKDTVMVYWPKGVTRIEARITEAADREDVRQEKAHVVDHGKDAAT